MATTNFIFKQDKKNACGITVCRGIIYNIKSEYISEDSMLGKVRTLDFTDNGWRQEFLNGGGSMPTVQLQELLLKGFDIKSEIKEDVPTKDIKQKLVLVVWELENGGNHWHAVLIRDIKNNNVFYMDPQSGSEGQKSIQNFDELRRPKGEADKRKFLEILCPSLKTDLDPCA